MGRSGAVVQVLILLAVLSSCNRYTEVSPAKGYAEFTFSKKERNTGGRIGTAPTPAFIVLSINDNSGKEIVKDKKLELQVFGQDYNTESLELPTGSYNLTKFLVLDSMNVVIYATPLNGADLAHYVDNPLPINFSVTDKGSVQVIPQVLAVNPEDSADSFGYVAFGFDVKKSKKLFSKEYFTFDATNQNFITSFKITYRYKNNKLVEIRDCDYNITTNSYDTTSNKLYEFQYNNEGRLSRTINFLGQSGTRFVQDYEYPSSTSTKVTEYELIGDEVSGKFWRILEKTPSTLEIRYFDENNVTFSKLNYGIDSSGNLVSLEMTPSNITGNIQYRYDSTPNPEYFPEFIETPFDVIQRYSRNNVTEINRIGYKVTVTIIYDKDGFPIEVTQDGTNSEYNSKTIYSYY